MRNGGEGVRVRGKWKRRHIKKQRGKMKKEMCTGLQKIERGREEEDQQ